MGLKKRPTNIFLKYLWAVCIYQHISVHLYIVSEMKAKKEDKSS